MPPEPIHVATGAARSFHVIGGDVITLNLTGEQTNGALTVLETVTPPGAGPPPHVHHRESETFYIIESEFEFSLPGRTIRAKPGDVVHAPKDVPHCFRNVGASQGKLLIVVQPSGFENFVVEFAALPPDAPPDLQKMAEIAARHGIEFLPAIEPPADPEPMESDG